MKKIVFAALMLLVVSLPMAAQPMPPGKWWRRPEIAQRLGLSAEQQTRLDTVFRNVASTLIDSRADVEKLQLTLRNELEESQLNRTKLQSIAAQLSAARGRLFERELMMLVDMRAVLTDAQWTTLRDELDKRQERQQERGRPGQGQGQQPRPRPED